MAKSLPGLDAIPRNQRELKLLRWAVLVRMVSLGMFTQNELAERLGLKVHTLSRALLGRRRNPDVLKKLVRFAYGKKTDAPTNRAA